MKNRLPAIARVRPISTAVWVLLLLLLAPAAGIFAREQVPENRMKISEGRYLFKTYCASCHGLEARGDGSLAEYLRVRPADLTQLSAKNGGEFPFEEVRKQVDRREIARGHGSDMPVWGDAFEKVGDEPEEVESKILALVHYLRSVQAAGDQTDAEEDGK